MHVPTLRQISVVYPPQGVLDIISNLTKGDNEINFKLNRRNFVDIFTSVAHPLSLLTQGISPPGVSSRSRRIGLTGSSWRPRRGSGEAANRRHQDTSFPAVRCTMLAFERGIADQNIEPDRILYLCSISGCSQGKILSESSWSPSSSSR